MTSQMSNDLIIVGYWPQEGLTEGAVDEAWDIAERAVVIDYLETAPQVRFYRGMSHCRVCHCFNGSTEHSDGVYLWPQGYSHYLREHGVKPPAEFIAHIFSQ